MKEEDALNFGPGGKEEASWSSFCVWRRECISKYRGTPLGTPRGDMPGQALPLAGKSLGAAGALGDITAKIYIYIY